MRTDSSEFGVAADHYGRSSADWQRAHSLSTEQLDLEPLRVEHASEMAVLLDDPGLHTFIGGSPASAAELHDRYERQVHGRSADGSEIWLNWVLRRRDDGPVVGTVQATVTEQGGRRVAEVAWVVGLAHQGHGYAREAALAIVGWLREVGAEVVVAFVHPEHAASMAVARAIGLSPTDEVVDGETRWESGF